MMNHPHGSNMQQFPHQMQQQQQQQQRPPQQNQQSPIHQMTPTVSEINKQSTQKQRSIRRIYY